MSEGAEALFSADVDEEFLTGPSASTPAQSDAPATASVTDTNTARKARLLFG
ncbi:hypothetical protein [Cellulosimicrobium sp. Marseille-Q4280]|uniref:hypothetical protein n=1 Tax=Cellulosimicrobium sp. Marseille-Q4280 TaxID=2937992 RepID=UPI00203B471F|nr:hypothetical protein [Cellulosimicrobium sp. Marseille-Q4280]